MLVFSEEIFGPVACMFSFESEQEVIRMANDTEYGLGASVWTEDREKGERIAKNLESGMVSINQFASWPPQSPQGGIKKSGTGREMSKYGILEFCNMKTVVASENREAKEPWWFPYN